MNNFFNKLEEINKNVYEVKNDQMKQTQRNNMKQELLNAFMLDLEERYGENVLGIGKKGICFEIPNEEEGLFPMRINFELPKMLTTDLQGEVTERDIALEKKKAKAKESAEKKKRDIERRKQEKERKEREKNEVDQMKQENDTNKNESVGASITKQLVAQAQARFK